MQTELSARFVADADAQEAQQIIGKCVHCGFCNATCPTYQLLGDELDGPRGRIYLIKQMLEGRAVTRHTQLHLDRCLTCLNCQSTCPSGVEYGHLIDIGRRFADAEVGRGVGARLGRFILKEGLTSALFAPLMRLAQRLRGLAPPRLKSLIPPLRAAIHASPSGGAPGAATRTVVLVQGCVQSSVMPNIDAAVQRVLERAGIGVILVNLPCCGAVRTHLGDADGGLAHARAAINVLTPYLASGAAQSVIVSATACAFTIKEYGHALGRDADYRDRARQLAAHTADLSELLPHLVASLQGALRPPAERLAYHPPCTLQHGQGLRGTVEAGLRALGFELVTARDAHLCCGSAGTYSLLQPAIAEQLRARKLERLHELAPASIVSGNMGCIRHLQSGTNLPVRHWIEVLDAALVPP